jgi:RNA recognition motif-containing protein
MTGRSSGTPPCTGFGPEIATHAFLSPSHPALSPVPRSLGTAWVEFPDRASCEAAIDHFDGGQVDGSTISVKISVKQAPQREVAPPSRRNWGRASPPRASAGGGRYFHIRFFWCCFCERHSAFQASHSFSSAASPIAAARQQEEPIPQAPLARKEARRRNLFPRVVCDRVLLRVERFIPVSKRKWRCNLARRKRSKATKILFRSRN